VLGVFDDADRTSPFRKRRMRGKIVCETAVNKPIDGRHYPERQGGASKQLPGRFPGYPVVTLVGSERR
jgi:hypothetical protein